MALTEDVQLPAQPSSGQTKYIPLGGDGFRSPSQLVRYNSIVTGDASGGNLTQVVRMPIAWTAVIAWVRLLQDDVSAVIMDAEVIPDGGMGGSFNLSANNVSALGTFHSVMTWVPPPIILVRDDGATTPPTLTCVKANVDTENFRLNAEIYLYDKRAREVGQAEDLLQLLGRGGSLYFNEQP